MARVKINISKRVVIWLFLITGTVFILQLSESRYDNIDPHGLDYHLIEISNPCSVIDVCKLNKGANGINLSMKFNLVGASSGYILNLESTLKLTRVTLRLVTANNHSLFKPGVASNAVKGQALSKSMSSWRSGIVKIRKGQKKLKAILYLFTENAIYEVRQTWGLTQISN